MITIKYIKAVGLTIAAVVAVWLASCSGISDADSGPKKATVSGMIMNSDGTSAEGVRVMLFPADFNAYTDIAAAVVDSAITGEDGAYFFSQSSSGVYNVLCKRAGDVCYIDSVPVTENAIYDAGEAILAEPGSVSGRVRLQEGDDNRQIVILILGTSIYTMPEDTSGTFTIPALAEGRYRIRIMTTVKKYGYHDMTVNVRGGENTVLASDIALTYGVPGIGQVEARYASHSMRVILSWKLPDTANIGKICIFRNAGVHEEPYAVLENTSTTFADDLLLPDAGFSAHGDTVWYTVAACGRDGSLGALSSVPDIVRSQFCRPAGIITLEEAGVENLDPFNNFSVDGMGNVFIGGNGCITKIDSAGKIVATYVAQETSSIDLSFRKPESDRNGNVYCMHNGRLLKFTPDLEVASSLSIEGFEDGYVKVDPDGNIYLIHQYAGPKPDQGAVQGWLRIVQTDTGLTLIDSMTVHISEGVTRFTQYQLQDVRDGKLAYYGMSTEQMWRYYVTGDNGFDEPAMFDVEELLKEHVSFPLITLHKIRLMENGMTIISALSGESAAAVIFFVFDQTGAFFARFAVPMGDPTLTNYAFDGTDFFYYYDRREQKIYRHRLAW